MQDTTKVQHSHSKSNWDVCQLVERRKSEKTKGCLYGAPLRVLLIHSLRVEPPNPRHVWGISRQNILYSSKNLGELLCPITAWGSSRGVERGMLRALRQSGPEKRLGYLTGSWLRQQPFCVHWGAWSREGGRDMLWDLTLPIKRSPVISRLTQAQHLTPSFRVRVAREKTDA